MALQSSHSPLWPHGFTPGLFPDFRLRSLQRRCTHLREDSERRVWDQDKVQYLPWIAPSILDRL